MLLERVLRDERLTFEWVAKSSGSKCAKFVLKVMPDSTK